MSCNLPLRLTALAALAALGACQPASSDNGDVEGEIADGNTSVAPGSASATSPAPQPTPDAPALTPDAAKGETGARALLLDWARALENGDFAGAYALMGHDGAAADMSEAEYSDYWSGFGRLTVAVPEGQVEGAAGSLYYEVPATITAESEGGNTSRWEGPVVLRRVNDVDGASAEQLRWHIESVDLTKQ